MVDFGAIHDWTPEPGTVVSWHAEPETLAIARSAPYDDAPPSFQQEEHVREFTEHQARGLDMARLCYGIWDIPGQCDITAMTTAINSHIRRHDTYHSWFQVDSHGELVRRTIADPNDISFAPEACGLLGPAQLREHLLESTPDPTSWGCFSFGIIQRADHFTVYTSLDHLVTDGMSAGVIFIELHLNYLALLSGAPMTLPPPASHRDFCIRERSHNAGLSTESPQIKHWIEFAERNGGTLPDFPLPLGDPTVPSRGGMVVVPLMDEAQGAAFDTVCEDVGVRFTGGMFACAALAERELTGVDTYCALTPYDLRSTPLEQMTPGWFASFMPVVAPVGGQSFAEVARAAQASFDSAKELAHVPFERVIELARSTAPSLRMPSRAIPLLSFIDARKVAITDQWDSLNLGIYGDSRLSDQVCIWVNRFTTQTTLIISYPDNPVARDSISRYIEVIKAVYSDITEHARVGAA